MIWRLAWLAAIVFVCVIQSFSAQAQSNSTNPDGTVAPLPPPRNAKEPRRKSGRKTVDERYEECLARMVELTNPSDDWMRQCLGLPKPTPKPTPGPTLEPTKPAERPSKSDQPRTADEVKVDHQQRIALQILRKRWKALNDCLTDYQKRVAAYKLLAAGDLQIMVLWRDGKARALRFLKSTINDPIFLRCSETALANMDWPTRTSPLSVEYFLQVASDGQEPRFNVSRPPEVQP